MSEDGRFHAAGIHERTPKQYQYSGEDHLAHEALIAYVKRRSNLAIDVEHDLVFRKDALTESEQQKVKLISGGGSGHEPMHIGFVGKNLLDAAVVGDVFASPAPPQVRSAVMRLAGSAGILMIVKNYTGDVLNFALAAAQASCPVNTVCVTDDISLKPDADVGRRGLAGTILIHKILGAAASEGMDLPTLTKLGQTINDNLATIGCSLDACVLPTGQATYQVAQDELAVGSGVTFEPGPERQRPVPTMHELARTMANRLINNLHGVRFEPGDELGVLVNNLGGTSAIELEYIASLVHECLIDRSYSIKRVLTGAFCTALNGIGLSVTLLNFTKAGGDTLRYFDFPVPDCDVWPKFTTLQQSDWSLPPLPKHKATNNGEMSMLGSIKVQPEAWLQIVRRLIENLEKHLYVLTVWDTVAGDGDCGQSLLAGAKALLEDAERKQSTGEELTAGSIIGDVVNELLGRLGGTMGAFICIFLSSLSAPDAQGTTTEETVKGKWASKLASALSELEKSTHARRGDRTFMDSLCPFVESLRESGDLSAAVQAASLGALSTRDMLPRFGRAKYHDSDTIMNSDSLDAGAAAVAIILASCCQIDLDFTSTSSSPIR